MKNLPFTNTNQHGVSGIKLKRRKYNVYKYYEFLKYLYKLNVILPMSLLKDVERNPQFFEEGEEVDVTN